MQETDIAVSGTCVCSYSYTVALAKQFHSFKPEGTDTLSYKVLSDLLITSVDLSDCSKV